MLNKKTVGGFILGALVLLIFFSKTIYAYNLPTVTAAAPKSGRLNKLEISSGIADWDNVEKLYAAVGGTVEQVLAEEGDAVTEGQELARLSFDRDEAERKLREIQNNKSKLDTDIKHIDLKLSRIDRYISDLTDEDYEEEDVSRYELDLLEIDIKKARLDLTEARERYESGGSDEEEADMNRARYVLQGLYVKQQELEKKLKKQSEDAERSLEDKEKARQSKMKDYEADKAALKLDLQAKYIDLDNLALQEEPYKKALADFETHAAILAPVSGTLVSLDIGKGEAVREDQLVASIAKNGEFIVNCVVPLDNNFVVPGDTCELGNTSRVLEGVVTKVTPSAQGKTVSVAFRSDEAIAGETYDVTFEKESQATYTLVPNGALCQDNDGYFLNQIKRRDGILGKEYYLERLDVYIGDSDSKNTAIIRGVTFFEPVALISDKPVTPGDVIALENEGDFFEQ